MNHKTNALNCWNSIYQRVLYIKKNLYDLYSELVDFFFFFGKFAFLQFRFKRSINSVWRWRSNCFDCIDFIRVCVLTFEISSIYLNVDRC